MSEIPAPEDFPALDDKTKNEGGPAFPSREKWKSVHGSRSIINFGMSLRDYFAGQALTRISLIPGLTAEEEIAERAYMFADAMLEARKGQ